MSIFENEVASRVKNNSKNKKLKKSAFNFLKESYLDKYSYNYSFFGRPIIQYPEDIVSVQELIFKVKPDLIIETGIAHGGSIVLSAGMMILLNSFEPKKRLVLGVDIDIRKHNLTKIKKHPFYKKIKLIEGDSTKLSTYLKIKKISKQYKKILVFLDSNHTHDHVLKELLLYAPLTSNKSYCVVFDTIINDLPNKFFRNRPWSKTNNPKTAVKSFLKKNKSFKLDKSIENKSLITSLSGGVLKKI
ncbi:cephalosporin hydroxylase family protein [bacterium]|nr:cephalosporin hydroxylase family protein [bacterium]